MWCFKNKIHVAGQKRLDEGSVCFASPPYGFIQFDIPNTIKCSIEENKSIFILMKISLFQTFYNEIKAKEITRAAK